jgi:lipoprotein signal peptidase
MRYRLLFTVAALVAAVNAFTQLIAVALSAWRGPVFLPGGWALQVVHNNGVIGGLGAGTIAPDVFAVGAAVQIAVLAFLTRRQPGARRAVALGLLAGAAIGNEGESRLFGYVVDWIWPAHLPLAFNLADVAMLCGGMLMVTVILHPRTRRTQAAVTP